MKTYETTRPCSSLCVFAFPYAAFAQDVPSHVDALLKQIKAADKDQLAVSEEDDDFFGCWSSLAERSTRSKLAPRAATALSGWGWACAKRAASWSPSNTTRRARLKAAANVKKAGLSILSR